MQLHDFSRRQLAALVAEWNYSAVHADRLWTYLYREGLTDLAAAIDLPAALRLRLLSTAPLSLPSTAGETHSDDGLTRKYLLELADGERVETVLMRYPGRATACVSSQAGCAVGCVFCATGQMGFRRNLSAGEIVAQALHVERVLQQDAQDDKRRPGDSSAHVPRQPSRRTKGRSGPGPRRQALRNIVLMGMGEPLLNYDAVIRAIDILRDPSGLSLAAKHITLSTVGVVPGIVRLADERQPCSLAVSLHAATQDERAELVPKARAWPLDALIEACRYYSTRLDRKIFFEWTLIAGRNDSADQALALARLVRGMPAQINLIPLNPTAGYSGRPGGSEAADRFQAVLRDHDIKSTIRQRRGIDIAAGCGQLAVSPGA